MRMNPGGEQIGILEDDQPLYDWGIENTYDQYYGENIEGQPGHGPHHGYPGHHPCYGDPNRPRPDGYNLPEHVVPGGRPDFRSAAVILNNPMSSNQSSKQDRNQPIDMKRYHPPPIQPNGPMPSPQGSSNGGRRPMMPQFDMDANEVLKMERKRARNRIAASKCRMRKLERIAVLDHQAGQLKADNDELRTMSEKLKAEVYALKQEIKWHVNNGCKVWRGNVEVPERVTVLSSVSKKTVLDNSDKTLADVDKGDAGIQKCEIASPDSTTNHLLYHEARVKRELADDELLLQQQMKLHSNKDIPNTL